MATTWVVPGAPLLDGAGWRLWYAAPGLAAFNPQPVEVRRGTQVFPLKEPRDFTLLDPVPGFSRRIGIAKVELVQPHPGQSFRLRIPEVNQEFEWQTGHSSVPDQGVSFVMASCFWRYDDKEGYYEKAIDAVMKCEKPPPAFRLLMGDQVYVDWPWPERSAGDYDARIGQRYEAYWGDSVYRQALLRVPNYFMCDDHEFWNNFPEWQVQLPFTVRQSWRDEFEAGARRYYHAFQQCLNPCTETRPWISFDIPPASFFVLDTRSQRSRNDGRGGGVFASGDPHNPQTRPDQLQALADWQWNLKGPGILVLPQPIFEKDGNSKDYSLSNFHDDFGRLLDTIERSFRGENAEGLPHDILILSGDIHTGRHAIARPKNVPPGTEIHEMIASPLSRIGPFLTTPSPQPIAPLIRGRLKTPQGLRELRWEARLAAAEGMSPDSIDNNLAIVRLFPAKKAPYKLRVQFRRYLVRRHRPPSWQFWSRPDDVDFEEPEKLVLYSNEKNELNLR